ncbi:hypothetical protein F5B22DRAFT_202721 [Xylaria bambusicola]|uniref:uncharacterized protein n=1 Tax=Xylaria bambusicola TaxID=326684 RepID=UPI0020080647|nr:uncharacterized protein F5B22DRAFT_202721 [Xylaria bambusicola]KAI0515112.1 hypothetical protein F5B22DRAFT_202721 [Xylaria bambusicola]
MGPKPKPTPQNHHSLHVPRVDWDRLTPSEWSWPHWKFRDTKPNDIWDSLYEKYNCIKLGIQDPYAWHSDVSEIAHSSKTKEEFEAALLKRRDERFNEIRTNWEKARRQLTANPPIWDSPPTEGLDRPWWTFVRFGRHFTFDTIVGHFGNYMVADTDSLYGKKAKLDAQTTEEVVEPSKSSSSRQPEQPRESQQPLPNSNHSSSSSAPPFPTAPAGHQSPVQAAFPAPDKKNRKTRVTRVGKGPAARSKIEKPPPRQRGSKNQPAEGVRRSARLQAREKRRGE